MSCNQYNSAHRHCSQWALLIGIRLWEFNETDQIAVRQGDWKLIVKKGVPHLYNLATDLHEDVDLASKYPEQVEKMKEIIFREHTHSPYFSVTLPGR